MQRVHTFTNISDIDTKYATLNRVQHVIHDFMTKDQRESPGHNLNGQMPLSNLHLNKGKY